jgi:hypothetical protein
MIFVSAGHYPSKPGASFEGFTEYDEASDWADLIVAHLGDAGVLVPTGFLGHKVGFINARAPKLAIEIHFNSFKVWEDLNKDGLITDDELKAAGRGCETLYFPGSVRGQQLAETVHAALSSVFTPDRGIKEGWYRMQEKNGPDYFLAKTSCPAIIIEPDFIHRKEIIQNNRDDACELISLALMDAQKELYEE